MTRVRSLVSGLIALAVLAAIVAGLPILLLRFGGSPFPQHPFSMHRLLAALTSRDDGGVALGIIKTCSWLAWILFTICVLTELQATLRGRSAPRLHLGGLQGSAARLVALAALVFASPAAMSLAGSISSANAEVASLDFARHWTGQSASSQVRAAALRTANLDASRDGRTITVRTGDCLWSIAQEYLGAGDRYQEIFRMNYDRDVGDGSVFTNAALIEPGWRLLLPASGTDRLPHSPRGNGQTDGAVVKDSDEKSVGTTAGLGAEAGAGAGARSGRHLGHATKDPHYRRRHEAARRESSEASSGPEVSDLGRSQGSSSSSPGDLGAADSAPVVGRSGQDSASSAGEADRLPQAASFVAGALAGSVLTSLNSLRRRQRQTRRRGRRIPLSLNPIALATEHRMRAAATSQVADSARATRQGSRVGALHDALRLLEAGIVRTGQVLPDIVGLHVTPRVLEVLLAAPASDVPPAPYEITPGRQGMCWQLDTSAAFEGRELDGPTSSLEHETAHAELSRPGCHLLCGLFTAGATDDGYLLLDLESLQVTGCDGPRDLVDQVVVSTATELATGQWSGWYDLILVGCSELETVGRAEHFDTVEDAVSYLESRCSTVAARFTDFAGPDVRQLRIDAPEDEDWGLTILVTRIEPSAVQLERLLDLAENGPGGVAVLTAGDPETTDGRMAPAVLQLAPDPDVPSGIVANVVPLQITLRPQPLSTVEYASITELFTVAADLSDVAADGEPYARYGGPPWIPQAAAMEAPADLVGQLWDDYDEEPVDVGDLDVGCLDALGASAVSGDDCASDRDRGEQGDTGEHGETREHGETDEHGDTGEHGDAGVGPIAAEGLKPAEEAQLSPVPPTLRTTPRHAAAPRLQIKILGPFTISGTAEQLQPKQAELVLALALAAPGGLANSALCAMLGPDPDHPKPGDAVRQTITRTRRRLGRARDGREYIIHTGNGHYVLHPDSWLDLTEFRDLVATREPDNLRLAVSMIRGQPFSGSYFWWIDIPLLETVRAELVDTSEMVAEIELASGYSRAAARAARAGLLAEDSAEPLWRALMRAEHAAGNLAGVTEAWRRCLDAIEDITPGGEPHPDTESLYRELTRSARYSAPARS